MRALQKAVALIVLLVLVVEFVGCAGSSEPRARKRSSNTTAKK